MASVAATLVTAARALPISLLLAGCPDLTCSDALLQKYRRLLPLSPSPSLTLSHFLTLLFIPCSSFRPSFLVLPFVSLLSHIQGGFCSVLLA